MSPAEAALGVQETVTRILHDATLFDALRRGSFPDLARRLPLADGVLDVIRTIDVAGLQHHLHTIQAKHLRHAEGVLPVSMAVARERLGPDRLRQDFWTRAPLGFAPAAELRSVYLALGRAYLEGLPVTSKPPWLADLARFEATRGGSATAPPRGQAAADRFLLSGDVTLCAFDWDVVSLFADLTAGVAPAEPGRIHRRTLLAVRATGEWRSQVFRLGPATYEVLRRCARPARLDDLVDAVGGEAVAADVRKIVTGAVAGKLLITGGGA
ncbi:hypothetical protein [Kutzneria kofuensis]|uniref:Uncharacterized protein n=1 Tax=Kutzneria kofuensis TaxID=103725 RepID=A0A7W9NL97_9PSEU|nr:hypothetical protein [Kutzneria kofuensis]MBB5896078.1 hypothetical protein [Kutzneria kofuensis]